jgi:hypothetical protein
VGRGKVGLPEILRRRHAALLHDVHERGRAVLTEPEFAHDHGRGAQQPHYVFISLLEERLVGDGRFFRTAGHDDRLQVLRPHKAAHAAPADRVRAADHDDRHPDQPFTRRADARDLAVVPQMPVHFDASLPPQPGSVLDHGPGLIDLKIDRITGLAGDHDRIIASLFELQRERPAHRGIEDRAGERRTGDHGHAG